MAQTEYTRRETKVNDDTEYTSPLTKVNDDTGGLMEYGKGYIKQLAEQYRPMILVEGLWDGKRTSPNQCAALYEDADGNVVIHIHVWRGQMTMEKMPGLGRTAITWHYQWDANATVGG